MSFAATVLLGAIAGFTIFLGLPIARLRRLRPGLQAFLNALATGILIFLLWDVLTHATEPIDTALDVAKDGNASEFVGLLIVFVAGLGVGLLSLVYFERLIIRRAARRTGSGAVSPLQLSLMIAIGIGLHNFSEGLAIGQSAQSGAIGLATILIIGFGLHNATEGFGIAAPLTSGGVRPSWAFLGGVGLIGGGPTFLGTLLGYSLHSPETEVLFLALAAGSILYVVSEMLHVGRRFSARELAMWGLLIGFLLGYATDLIVTWGGA
jgi:ZIP family zinc transporter